MDIYQLRANNPRSRRQNPMHQKTKNRVSFLSSLPPTKGISKYTSALLVQLDQFRSLDILTFKNIYPDFLYPGGTKDESLKMPVFINSTISSKLSWYNPFGWIWSGWRATGKIFHIQWWSPALAPIYLIVLWSAALRRKRIVLVTIHNVELHESSKLFAFFNSLLIRQGDYFIVHSEKGKVKASELYHIPLNKLSIIRHGMLTPDLQSSQTMSDEDCRKELGIEAEKKVILFFGIIREYKGLDILINALKEIKKSLPEVHLIIAGKPWVDWEHYSKQIHSHGLDQKITLKLEFVPEGELDVLFKASNIVVFPYKHFDSQSGAAALALSYSKPMVVSNLGGLIEMVSDEAAIVEPNNETELAEKITRILTNDELYSKLVNDSKQLAKLYDWHDIALKTDQLYDNLLNTTTKNS